MRIFKYGHCRAILKRCHLKNFDSIYVPISGTFPGVKGHSNWHQIAERLAESGWSWQHVRLSDRAGRNRHVAEAHNEEGHTHAVVAPSVGQAFGALERSVERACK